MDQKYTIFTLPNGLRMVHWHTDGLVSYIGVLVNVGSRDEAPEEYGLAHFVEHTIFKGTGRRKNWQIFSRMETVGGELNAYTSKEETMIYTNAPAGYEERAMELLADLITDSRFPREETEREREVVIEEIHSYLDSPSEAVYDEFEELAYAGSGLAHNILGSEESVRRLDGSDCRGFVERFYTPGEMVMYCSTPMPAEKMRRLVEKYFGGMCHPDVARVRVAPPAMESFTRRKDGDNHQANTIIGTRVFGREDPRRFALYLLNNYLGGPCMNSRLTRELREKRGYVYAVDSNVGLLSDTGLMLVYFGCDPGKVDKCFDIVRKEIDRVAQNKLSEQAFEKIKRQYCGQLLVGSDHRENRSMSLAKSVMYYNEIIDISAMAEYIRKVTREEFMDVAQLIAGNPIGSLTLV